MRVNCVIPDWVATERVSEAERSTDPPLISLDEVADGVLMLLRDDALAGRALLLLRGEPPRLL